ncbi:MAG: glycoside hydrolase family 18 protein [Acidobacteriia bacterium]|nr:glycoside hydrolase family 18 protein [Terriglobia bacterium]
MKIAAKLCSFPRSSTSVPLMLGALLCLLTGAAMAQDASAPKRLLGYYPEWSKYNDPPYVYSADQIPYSQLTHISHAFLLLDKKADGTLDEPQGFIEPNLISMAHAAGVKVLVSIGGGDGIQGPRFNKMARVEAYRQAFAQNVHAFLTSNGYDGVDIDWEIPNARDMSDCTTLMQELRNELPSPWLISMATPSDPRSWGAGFDIPALAPLVDFMNVMTYDFTGSWAGFAGLNSPLLQDPADPIQSGSVKTSMDLYANIYGVPLAQLNIGIPFYGYEFDGVDVLWAACSGCAVNQQNYGDYIKPLMHSSAWQKQSDKSAKSPYMVNSTLPGFITYDNASSTSSKTRYILKQRGFSGVFMWELSADYDGKSQDLMDAMYKAWLKAQ